MNRGREWGNDCFGPFCAATSSPEAIPCSRTTECARSYFGKVPEWYQVTDGRGSCENALKAYDTNWVLNAFRFYTWLPVVLTVFKCL